MTKVENMRSLLAAGDRPGAVTLAHELLSAHGISSRLLLTDNWPVVREALEVVRSRPGNPGFFGVDVKGK